MRERGMQPNARTGVHVAVQRYPGTGKQANGDKEETTPQEKNNAQVNHRARRKTEKVRAPQRLENYPPDSKYQSDHDPSVLELWEATRHSRLDTQGKLLRGRSGRSRASQDSQGLFWGAQMGANVDVDGQAIRRTRRFYRMRRRRAVRVEFACAWTCGMKSLITRPLAGITVVISSSPPFSAFLSRV